MDKGFTIIVATDKMSGIGKDGSLPWPFIPEEMAHFTKTTKTTQDPKRQNAVIMGRKTWDSIPEKFRPLRGRKNIVLTRTPALDAVGFDYETNLDVAIEAALTDDTVESVFVIGGGSVYNEAIKHDRCQWVIRTVIFDEFDCDTFFEFDTTDWEMIGLTSSLAFRIEFWSKK